MIENSEWMRKTKLIETGVRDSRTARGKRAPEAEINGHIFKT
ncbi:hypothetical protein [Peribacillus sp. NPDC097895]